VDDQADHQTAESNTGARNSIRAEPRVVGLLPWVFLVLIALVFARTLWFGFVNWDDSEHVYANPAVVGAGGAHDRWLTPSLGYPVPVTVATYRIEYQLAGASPWIYHATNVLLHLGVCVLLYGFGRRLGLGKVGASFALLFFGLHPVVAEPVCWISGRKDVLATLLGLAATYLFLGPVARPGRRGPATILATLLFALAVFAKPSVLALPSVWVLARLGGARPRWWSALPAMAIALGAAALSWLGEGRVGALHAMPSLPGWAREVHYALGYHLGLALFIQRPLAKHIPAQMPPWFDPAVDLLPLGLGLLAWLWLRAMGDRHKHTVHFGLLFAVMAYLPSSGIAPLVRYLADSYVYLPLVGLAWLAGVGVENIIPFLRPAWRWVGGFGIALVLLFSSLVTSMAWRDGVALWQTVYRRYSDSPQVCLNLGTAYFEQGQAQTALGIFERCSLQFGPDHFAKNRAIALFLLGRHVEAGRLLQELAVKYPSDPVVRKYLGLLGLAGRAR
jgi:hypothetical protein